MWGANADELDRLAALLAASARELDAMHRQLGRQLHSAPWRGPVADRFRQGWATDHRAAVVRSSAFLSGLDADLRRQATQQRNASAAGGGAASSSSAPSSAQQRRDALDDRYRETQRRIEERKRYLRDEIKRLKSIKDEGGVMEFLGDINPLADSKAEARHAQIERLQAELDALDGLKNVGGRQLLKIDGTPGDQRIVEVHGDLSNARKVIVHVPGMETDLGDYGNGHSNAKALYDEARRVYGDDVVVVSFADYNIPDDLGEAASTAGAEDGAGRLRSLVGDLHRMGFAAGDISVVAHSYGTVVAGHAMQDGLDVGRVVALGSPGMGADDRSGLGSPQVDLWAASAPIDATSGDQAKYTLGGAVVGFAFGGIVGGIGGGLVGAGDPVSWAPAHGESPAADGFGAHQFDVPDAYGHSAYFEGGSRSLENITRLATGRDPM